jgi:hypothetical protein
MLAEYARRVRATVVASVDSLPEHAAYIQRQLGVSAT